VTAGTGADGEGNGIIGPSDYNVWRQNFGRARVTSGSAAGLSTVPEPCNSHLVGVIALSAATLLRLAPAKKTPRQKMARRLNVPA
jgi:hypothetical protein